MKPISIPISCEDWAREPVTAGLSSSDLTSSNELLGRVSTTYALGHVELIGSGTRTERTALGKGGRGACIMRASISLALSPKRLGLKQPPNMLSLQRQWSLLLSSRPTDTRRRRMTQKTLLVSKPRW